MICRRAREQSNKRRALRSCRLHSTANAAAANAAAANAAANAAAGVAGIAADAAAWAASRASQTEELKRVLACTEAGIDPYPPQKD